MKNIRDLKRPLNTEQTHLLESMKSKIEADGINTVSFEMFEMLVVRPLFDKLDTAFFMEREFGNFYVGKQSFYEIRCEAEEYVRKRADRKKKCPTIEDIYSRIEKTAKLSPSGIEKLMKRECSLKEFFCFPRSSGYELYSTAKKLGRKIIITADTCLPRRTVEKILENCGYTGYDALYITGDCGAAKLPDGELFSKISSEMKLVPSKTLHFGCTFDADTEAPIKQGWKSMLVPSCRDRLVKSGRICGYIQKQLFYDFASEKHLALRCILALYAVYAFDYPQSKVPHSDFCGDCYMMGFLILGALSCHKDYIAESKTDIDVLSALGKNSSAADGKNDFITLFDGIFGDTLEKFGFGECDLPLKFLACHGAVGDRMNLDKQLSPIDSAEWGAAVTEPELAPVFTKARERNFGEKLVDRMFPPNTKVRKILDRIMAKIHL
ncbi:MAG: hypothetical protein PUA81_05625 [Oscillospiraceae bacterium]|nr:hypothetical protein [Oscillospiraceae bacterium]